MTGNRRSKSIGPYGQRMSGAESKLVIRRKVQSQSLRKREAMKEVSEHQRRLDQIIERQAQQPALGAVVGAEYSIVTREALQPPPAVPTPPLEGPRGAPPTQVGLQPGWTIWRAREYLRQGYTVEQTMRRSGCRRHDLEGIPIDEDGRGLPA